MPVDSRPPPLTDGDLRIRPAEAADLVSLLALETAAFASDRLTRRRLRALAGSPSAIFLVAESADALTGYVLVLTRRNGRTARLYSLAVAPTAAGRGIGSRLVAAAEAAARLRGADQIRLEVRVDNLTAVRLYEARGYRTIGRREDYYADGMAAIRYMRDLRAQPTDTKQPDALGRAA